MVVAMMTEHPRRSPGRSPTVPPSREEIMALARFARRLERLIARTGLTHTEVAERVQTTKQAVSSWTRGENFPSHLNMLRLASVLGVDIGELWGGSRADVSSTGDLASTPRLLPLYGSEQAAGEGIMGLTKGAAGVESVTSPIGLSERAVALQVTSEANLPAISPGDIVYVDPGEPLAPGRWVLAYHGGEYLVRKYVPKSPATIRGGWLMPANTAYKTEQIARTTEIIGVVTGRHETL